MKNPVKNISIDTKQGKKHRLYHEEADLSRIFYSPLYKGFQSPRYRYKSGGMMLKDAKFWLPLIALYTGARQEELAQVYLKNVIEKKGVLYLQLYDWEDDQSIKNENSMRTVPLHNELLRFGFREYIKKLQNAAEQRLFPDLKISPDGRYAKEF